MERREHIIETAEVLFLERGPAKTTVAEIARRAMVAVGTVYLEFESKDHLLQMIARRFYDRLLSEMRAICREEGRTAYDGVLAAIRHRVHAMRGRERRGRHACSILRDACPGSGRAFQRFMLSQEQLLTEALTIGARTGSITLWTSPNSTARAVLRAYAAFDPPGLFAIPATELDAALEDMHQLVVEGLRVRSA